ncbi:hypothetical protein HPULCUR_003947 [Helicostylum pulchrum]|uniref:Uncharacterized protein n=1 Tax=Helicostylum pulchrum TaxID=562976 RepID=A0ABP9XUV6_9FUNG
MKASETAAETLWYNKSVTYRSRMIRLYAKSYLESGKIDESMVSVLDDNDTKKKVLEWFRSVPKLQRNIPTLQNELRTVIVPAAIENYMLNVEVDDSGAITNPLSIECIRNKLIQWTLDLVSAKLYFLNRVNSATVPTNHKEYVVNMMWELKIVAESVDVLKLLETSHDKNKNTPGATKLESFLGETAEVKLPGGQLAEIDDIFLASSPIRPSSDRSTSSSENL